MAEPFDLLVIGGGINGAGIARDAAGRGLSVLLCEKDDLASGTSSRSSKLIHGGLRYLEQYEFRLVREALIEREVLLGAAPHIVRPMRFVLPLVPGGRPEWLVRLGLFLYDHLGGRRRLAATRRMDLARDAAGAAIRPEYRGAFEYSDCTVDDARLVVLNALDAARRGAEIRTRCRAVAAQRRETLWQVALRAEDGSGEEVAARVLVNTAGPWVEEVLGTVTRANARGHVRLVKGSHIIVRKFWAGDHAYLLQNDDKRVIFVIPYEGELCLIGTTDIPFEGDADAVAVEEVERTYLLAVVARTMRRAPAREDIVAEYSGVRPLYDDAAKSPSAVTRDYVFDIEAEPGGPALLSVFGGKITTYRKLAEHALKKLAPQLVRMGPAWTATAPLPGGEIPGADFGAFVREIVRRFAALPQPVMQHYARLYGTRAEELLAGVGSVAGLGRHFGGLLYEREGDFLLRTEWARTAEDVLVRRTKHYLHLNRAEQEAFAGWMARAC